MTKKRMSFYALGLLSVALLYGCGTPEQQATTPTQLNEHQHQVASGDIQEHTAALATMPTFLDNATPKIKNAYLVASQNIDLLKSMPCYCGCGESAGNMSNLKFFVKPGGTEGSVFWDDHGTRCDTCMNIAVESAQMKQQGKSTLEIRNFIDNKYKEGYAKPTPTPMPN